MNLSDLLHSLSSKLNLIFESQDWGIINADSNRFEEFLLFYENNPDLHITQKYHLFELIIASYNEALIEDTVEFKKLDDFKRFLLKYKDVHNELIEYWTSLNASDEFPIVRVLCDINK